MLDRTIPFYNTILRCDHYQHHPVVLPKGFSIVSYQPGYEKAWAKLEYAIEDFGSVEEAETYFVTTYLHDDTLLRNILFLVNAEQEVIGTCIAWQDERKDSLVSSLHWLVVDEAYHSLGLGKALCHAVMNIYAAQNAFPVYIHTQPWSWKAIFLYLSLGFRLQKTDSFSHYENQYPQAMETLQKIVTEDQYLLFQNRSEE